MNTSEHPKALGAKLQTALREIERLKIKKAVAEHNLHFFALGRYTFCYRVDKRNVLEISSSIRHPDDKHDPKPRLNARWVSTSCAGPAPAYWPIGLRYAGR